MEATHIDIRYHYIRETVNNDTVSISYCQTEEILLEIFNEWDTWDTISTSMYFILLSHRP